VSISALCALRVMETTLNECICRTLGVGMVIGVFAMQYYRTKPSVTDESIACMGGASDPPPPEVPMHVAPQKQKMQKRDLESQDDWHIL
jgi:hypothetical protein